MSVPRADDLAGALERAARFLTARGAAREARYVAALAGSLAPAALAADAAAAQDPSGALAPLLAGDAPGPGVASTADALGWLIGLGVTEGAPIERAAAFLMASQDADGGWSDPAAADEQARLALAATLCGHLARCPAVRLSALRRAAGHVARHGARARVEGGGYRAIASTFHAFAAIPAELDLGDEALQWCGRELERGFRTGALDAVQTARVFALCDAVALPGARLRAEEVAAALLRAQASDGGFGAEPGRERATCEAALGLRHLAQAGGRPARSEP
jgi:hypothetical protein